jgi:hypothetical protein
MIRISKMSMPAAPLVALGITVGTLTGTVVATVSAALDHKPAFAQGQVTFVCTNGTETVSANAQQAAQLRKQGYTCTPVAGGK